MLKRLLIAAVLASPIYFAATAKDFREDMSAYKQGDLGTALKDLQPLAQKGDARAQYRLALMYLRGDGVRQGDAEGVEWFRKAAEQGHAEAQYSLAVMYHIGLGVSQDDSTAAKWFRKAADQGHAKAQDSLGFMYLRGEGVARDDDAAAAWFRKASEQEEAAASAETIAMNVAVRRAVAGVSGDAVEKPAPAVGEKPAPAVVGRSKDEPVEKQVAVIEKPAQPAATPQAPAKQPSKAAPKAPQTSKKVSSPPRRGDYRVQLGSVKAEARAVTEAVRLNRIHKAVLGDLIVVPVRASVGKRGVFYRLRAGPIPDLASATSMCRKLSAVKQRCMVAKR